MAISTRATTVVSVYLLLRKENQILFGLRQNTGYCDGQYGLVSGHVEPDEPATDAMVREAQEEVGITPFGLRVAHVMHRKSNRFGIDIFFECDGYEGTPTNKEPDKCTGLEFFPIDNIPSNTMDYVAKVLKAIHQGHTYSEEGWI